MDRIELYWQQFLASFLPDAPRPARFGESASFGFTPQDASEISRLVLDDVKTATGSPLWSYQADSKPVPQVGDFWIVIDGTGEPVCVVRTFDVRIIAFDEMPEDYALWGGEGDLSMEFWRRIYWEYIVTECARIGRATSAKRRWSWSASRWSTASRCSRAKKHLLGGKRISEIALRLRPTV